MTLFGGIEAGGTKFVCAIGSGLQEIHASIKFPTTTPGETLQNAVNFFVSEQNSLGDLSALGVASFGPLDPRPDSPTYGFITTTPKHGWAQFNFVGELQRAFNRPIGFDTDVNGAALAEWRWGAAQGLDTFLYLTIGTGIGGGGLVNGKLMHGLIHPEMGHMLLRHDWESDPFPGNCPYHGDCFEGLASGPAIEKRWGLRAEDLPPDHPGWQLQAHYLALGLENLVTSLSPQRIILGGGVMQQPHIFPLVRTKLQKLLNQYVQAPEILMEIDQYIVPPVLGGSAGVLGALALAEQAFSSQ